MEPTLHLTLKKKWFDLIASGEKKEEYREIKQYWISRLTRLPNGWTSIYDVKEHLKWGSFKTVTFKNGYQKGAPTMLIECKGITVGEAKPEWSDNWQGEVFIIKLGEIFSTQGVNTTEEKA